MAERWTVAFRPREAAAWQDRRNQEGFLKYILNPKLMDY